MKIKKKIVSAIFIVLSLVCVSVSAESQKEQAYTEMPNTGVVVSIPVFCESENCLEDFEYRILYDDTDSVIISENILYLKNGEGGKFDILVMEPGIFHFEIVQLKGENGDVLYDDCVYEADVYCLQDGNTILSGKAVVYRKGQETKEDACRFRNYKVISDVEEINDTDIPEKESREDIPYAADRVKTGDTTGGIDQAVFEMAVSGFLCMILVFRMYKKQQK